MFIAIAGLVSAVSILFMCGAHAGQSCAEVGAVVGSTNCMGSDGQALLLPAPVICGDGGVPCYVTDCLVDGCICAPNASYCTDLGGGDVELPEECDNICFNPEPDWTNVRFTGYDRRSLVVQNALTCECLVSYEYRCQIGRYRDDDLLMHGQAPTCYMCPGVDVPQGGGISAVVMGTTSGYDAVGADACYMATGTVLKDDFGTYEYVDDCYYSL